MTIVALHGWGMNASAWDALMPHLPSNISLKAINLPGYAEQPEEKNMNDVIDWLATQFEGACHLVGWSMGGLVAQAFIQKYPNRVLSVSYVASTPCFVKKKGWITALDSEIFNEFVVSLKNNQSMTLRRFLTLQFMGESAAVNIQKKLRSSVVKQETSLATLTLGLGWLKDCDYREKLKAVHVNQHWMFGRLDQLIPVEVGQALKHECPTIMVSYFDECGHAPHLTQPILFVEKLLYFISKQVSK